MRELGENREKICFTDFTVFSMDFLIQGIAGGLVLSRLQPTQYHEAGLQSAETKRLSSYYKLADIWGFYFMKGLNVRDAITNAQALPIQLAKLLFAFLLVDEKKRLL